MWIESQNLMTAAQVRALEAHALAAGISEDELMLRAGRAAFQLLRVHWPEAKCLQVWCGTGNNGGDGFVLARLAHQAGLRVKVIDIGPSRAGSAGARARVALLSCGLEIESYAMDHANDESPDLIVDALLGIGIDRAPQAEMARAIEQLNAMAAARDIPVFALDLPSGVDADGGVCPGVAVRANRTASFLAHKRGLFTGEAVHVAGTVQLHDLDLPSSWRDSIKQTVIALSANQLQAALPARAAHAHKHQFGPVVCLGGELGMSGAIRLAGEAALRAGAGLTRVGTRAAHASSLNLSCPELMVHGVESKDEINALLMDAKVVLVGPGLGREDWSIAVLKQCVAWAEQTKGALVMDADALHWMVSANRVFPTNTIITPHPGEAANMLGLTSREVQSDRFSALQRLIVKTKATVVLKGNGTLIGAPDSEPTYLCRAGNPGMATAGMGDVLAGVIAACCAQGMKPLDAARWGVLAHACAGDAAARAGQRGLLASDVIAHLRVVLNA